MTRTRVHSGGAGLCTRVVAMHAHTRALTGLVGRVASAHTRVHGHTRRMYNTLTPGTLPRVWRADACVLGGGSVTVTRVCVQRYVGVTWKAVALARLLHGEEQHAAASEGSHTRVEPRHAWAEAPSRAWSGTRGEERVAWGYTRETALHACYMPKAASHV